MKSKLILVKDYNLGGLNLLPGTILISTDAMNGLEAHGVGIREPIEEPNRIEAVETREPQVIHREPKIRKSRLV